MKACPKTGTVNLKYFVGALVSGIASSASQADGLYVFPVLVAYDLFVARYFRMFPPPAEEVAEKVAETHEKESSITELNPWLKTKAKPAAVVASSAPPKPSVNDSNPVKATVPKKCGSGTISALAFLRSVT
jgi:hypothetical protein